MRTFFFLLRACCLSIGFFLATDSVLAQTWDWTRQTRSGTRGGASTYASTIAADGAGPTYVASSYGDSVRFGPTLLVTPTPPGFGAGLAAACVTQFSPTGQWSWTATATGPGNSSGDAVAPGAAGGALVAGWFSDTVRFGTHQLVGSLSGGFRSGGFLAQVSAAGSWQWAVALPPGADTRALAPDAAGSVVLAGILQNTATFGPTTLSSRGPTDTFVAKLSSAGQWLWAVQGGGLGEDGAIGLATGPGGTVYVTGGYTTDARFGALAPPSTGELDGYVAALDAAGTWQWVEPIPSSYFCLGEAVLREPVSGDLLVGGAMTARATFGATVLTADSVADAFVARFDPAARVWRWATAAANPGTQEWVTSLSTDVTGTAVYAAGSMGGTEQPSGPGPKPIATVTFGAQAVRGFGGYDGFVGRLDGATGQWQHATAWGGTDDDYASGMTAKANANGVTISGYFTSPSATVGPDMLTTNPGSRYPAEIMVAHLTLPPLGLRSAADGLAATLTPNPARTTTHLTLAAAPTARPLALLDAVGRLVRTATLPANQADASLDLRGLPAGLYVVRCGEVSRRLVVE